MSWETALNSELTDRVTALRQQGRTPKEIARALGLKPADVMPIIRSVAAQSPRREVPLAGCWVTDGWAVGLTVKGHDDWPRSSPGSGSTSGDGLAGVLVARDTGSTVTVCGFLVDVYCLGVKNTHGPKTMDRRKLPAFRQKFFSAWPGQRPVAAPLEMARHIVFGAVDYARGMGFEPYPDFARGASLLGEWEPSSSDVTFGRDGKPLYINGPNDDTYATMAKLHQAVGEGNFHFVIGSRGPA